MPEFLIELYVSRTDQAAVERGADRARLAADQLTREGTPVRYLRSIFVPEDETCFYLYEAASGGDVADAARKAGLPVDRVAEAVTASRETNSAGTPPARAGGRLRAREER